MKRNATNSLPLLPAIVLVVFICEAIVMAILHVCGVRGIWDIVLDPMLLSVLIAPILLRILPRLAAGMPSLSEDGVAALDKSSRWKTVAAFGSLGGIAALVLAGLAASHATFERDTIRTFQEAQLERARSLARGVQEIFEEVEQDLQFLAQDPDLVAVTPDAQEEIDSFWETHSDALNNITRADAEGNQILRSPALANMKNISHWPEFAAVRDSGASHIGEPQFCIIDQGVQVVRVMVPIDDQGKFGGVLYASAHLQRLWDKCLPRPEHGSFCWVIDGDGEILYDDEGRYTGRTWEQIEQEWLEAGGEGSQEEEAAEAALRARVQRGEEGVAAYRNNTIGGIDELMAFTPIRLGGELYGLAIATPRTEIAAPIAANARVTYALMTGMLLFLGVAGYVGLRGTRARAQLLAEQRHSAERKQAGEERERLLHDMGERVKELGCLHGVGASIRNRGTLEDIFRDAASLLAPGWRYPEIARGRVHFDGRDHVSEPFERTQWRQTSDITVSGERRGFVEVCYIEQRPDSDEGPFQQEERNLIDSIAHALSAAAEHKQADVAAAVHMAELEQRTIELEKSRRVAMGMMEDAEAARKAAEAAREELRLRGAALAAAASAIVITDHDGCIVWVNPAFTNLTGYTPDEAVGHNPRVLKSGKHDEAFYRDMWTTVLAGEVWRGELVNRRRDGSLYHEDMTITAVKDAQGTITHFIAIKQDITERKRLETQLMESNKDLLVINEIHQVLFSCQSEREVAMALTDALVHGFRAYFGRVWLVGPGDLCSECALAEHCRDKKRCLHLQASSGHYTHIDGDHRRVPLGAFKIGLIAQGCGKTICNDVASDDRVHDREWAAKHGLRSFAGFPLVRAGEVVGVMAMLSKHELPDHLVQALDLLAQLGTSALTNVQGVEALRDAKEASESASESLKETVEELETFNRLSVGRELRMIELKDEINELLVARGEAPKFEIVKEEVTA